ncbi:hypothetical protein RhiirA1_454233 [Rhizophagus irregularis]|uniref:DDE-1 domain-containing protein n=1 Tax=Rhizophagus irregularis TaxID=588596 RepID=A0A2N0S5N7_9GLOM|nr:hypothetical protein RhiirA1_454233 [Rhizophagus irregularis]
MDETPVWFDMTGWHFTINPKGEKNSSYSRNRKTNATQRTSSSWCCSLVPKNGWMDSSLMLKYIDYFNDIRSKNGTRRNPAMLVYDSFKGHLEGSLLDVLINKPFKDNLHKEWHTWMASGGAGETATVNLSTLD